MLKTQYKILACGTICTNKRGLDQLSMNHLKTSERSVSKIHYDLINGILFGQWKYNKVVSFISALLLVGSGITIYQCDRDKVKFTCPKALQAYNQFMGYVDLVGFDKKIGNSLPKGNISKKSTKKGLLLYSMSC